MAERHAVTAASARGGRRNASAWEQTTEQTAPSAVGGFCQDIDISATPVAVVSAVAVAAFAPASAERVFLLCSN